MSSKVPVIPITPFRGVLISWLMLARNSDLMREAADSPIASRLHRNRQVRQFQRTLFRTPAPGPQIKQKASYEAASRHGGDCPVRRNRRKLNVG